jgi:hemerythrin-like metal-binding protein
MVFFEWNEKYELGIESIDNDHKVLVGLIDDIYVALSKGDAQIIVHKTVSQLVDYAKIHFKREEYYMQMINYSEQFKHESEHKVFSKKVDDFVEKLDAGIANITLEVISFLRDWLINHIQQTDKKLGDELKKHKNIIS